eukprot:1160736-Pelagomonas_calceolata.AAC.6
MVNVSGTGQPLSAAALPVLQRGCAHWLGRQQQPHNWLKIGFFFNDLVSVALTHTSSGMRVLLNTRSMYVGGKLNDARRPE